MPQVTVWNFENGNVHYYQQILKYREYAKIMATACTVHANVMMGRHLAALYHHMPILCSLMLTKELLPIDKVALLTLLLLLQQPLRLWPVASPSIVSSSEQRF